MSRSRQPLTLEFALLGFLLERPLHGYEVSQRLADPAGLGQVWQVKQSRLYALFARLEREGYVTSTLHPQEGRPPRKVLALTPAGAATVDAWLRRPVAHGRQMRLHFLVKLYFAHRAEPGAARDLVEQQQALCRRWVTAERSLLTAAPPHSYLNLVHRFRLSQVEAVQVWLGHCHDSLPAAGA